MRARMTCGLALAIVTFALSGQAPQGQGGPVTYIYDSLGRLAGVVDGSGESAVYVYDAIGNLLSIERHSAGTVAILQFTPQSGPVGTTVTIAGTGFSATPGQNTLTFGGVSATIAGATSTQLVANVPAGAATGTIAVTTPSGSATSGSPFTVTGSNGAPTITSFTPSIATAGTPVTITGTNFQTTPADDRTMFNLRHAAVTSATGTTISTTVPTLAASGPISVYTPLGGAVGDDFFIPPPPFTAADVEFTARWDVNQSSTLTIATANRIGLAVFDGTAGHRISLRGTNGTFTGTSGCDVLTSILKPDGTVLSPAGCMEPAGFLDAVTMPTTGTYSILVDPSTTASGSLTLTPYDFLDVTGAITPGGSPVTATTTIPGQNGKYTFAGASGQRVFLVGTNGITGQILGCDVFTNIWKPDGTAIAAPTCMEGSGVIDTTTLPSAGTYSVLMDPAGTVTGSLTLTLYTVPADIIGGITPGGSPVTVTTTTPGQNAILTFQGTANQRVFLYGSNGISGQIAVTCDVTTTILKPDGSTLATACMEGSGVIDTQTLPATGTYSILVDPASYATGSLTLTLYDVPADISGSITPGGSPVAVATTTPGQNGRLTFTGAVNQRVSVLGTNGTTGQIALYCDVNVSLLRPNGSTQATACMEGSGFIDVQTLSTAGTYTLLVDPASYVVGGVTLTLYDVPANVSGSVTIGGAAFPITITTPGQNALITFAGTASQQATVRFTGNTAGSVSVWLLKPNGQTLTATTSSASSFNLATQTLPVTGTYSIVISPNGANTGSMNVAVTSP